MIVDRAQQAADAIAALSGASPATAKRALNEYNTDDLVAALAVSGGGAGASVVTKAVYSANTSKSPAHNGNAYFDIDTLALGDALLDVTSPDTPLVLVTGVYWMSAYVQCFEAMTTGGYFDLVLHMDAEGDDILFTQRSATKPATAYGVEAIVSGCWYLTAGMALGVQIINRDGSEAREFGMPQLVIQTVG